MGAVDACVELGLCGRGVELLQEHLLGRRGEAQADVLVDGAPDVVADDLEKVVLRDDCGFAVREVDPVQDGGVVEVAFANYVVLQGYKVVIALTRIFGALIS